VVTNGQIFRRVTNEAGTVKNIPTDIALPYVHALEVQAPLWQVINTALDRMKLSPQQLAATRQDLTLRSLLPNIIVRMAAGQGATTERLLDRAAQLRDVTGQW